MPGCPNCGSTGQANRDCPISSTEILWGGGLLCTGIGSGTLDDVITNLANTICGISTSLPSIALNDTSITITTSLGTCISGATLLSTWVPSVETLLCGLITTVGALDYSEPLYYNGTATVVAHGAVGATTDTITIAANTLNENDEYMKLEIYCTNVEELVGTSALTVEFMGVTLPFTFSATPPYVRMNVEINIVRSAANAMQYDWKILGQRLKSNPAPDFFYGGTASPVDWTISNDLVIKAQATTNDFVVRKVRLTKFCKH